MKTCLVILLTALLAANATAEPAQPLQPSAKTRIFSLDYESLLAPQIKSPNEIKLGRLTCSGVLPQIVNTKNPLQLINPVAPAQYWAKDGNADRDIVTHKITGFKFLSFSF